MKLTTKQKVGICLTVLAAVWVINNPLVVLLSLIINFPLIIGPLGIYLILTDYRKDDKNV